MKLKKNYKLIISADGSAASGKTTGAKRISKKYGLQFLSSGLLYRYASFQLLKYRPKNKINFLKKCFNNLSLKKLDNKKLQLPEISAHTSIIAKERKIRTILKTFQIKFAKKSNQKTRVIISSFLRLNDKLKSLVRFNFNLDQSLQNFFNGISNKVSGIKKVIIEEREKQKLLKIKQMENERKKNQRKLIQEGEIALKAKKTELKEEQKLERERKIHLQKFIRSEQAELRKERTEKQRNFLEQIKLEKH